MRWVLILAWLVPAGVDARPGDVDDPFVAPSLPFEHHFDTRGRASAVDTYACQASTSEAGPEVVYAVDVPLPGELTATVEGDLDPVDVDVHLLAEPPAPGARTTSCLARGNRSAAAEVEAGRRYVVVDTYQASRRAGPYRLRVDLAPLDAWVERPVARGVVLRTRRHSSLAGGRQTTSVLEVDLADPAVSVRPVGGTGCKTTSAWAREAGAVAAVNGGFFAAGCRSESLLKIDGALIATNKYGRTAVGFLADRTPAIARIEAGRDWPEVQHALGGVSRLLSAGDLDVTASDEHGGGSFETSRHPRTAAAIAADGRLLLAAVDGRTSAGLGMTLAQLAEFTRDLGGAEALNLDGGGSTTMWVATEPFGGVVNHPSDNGLADHEGERAISNVLAVFAPARDLAPVWLTTPPPEGSAPLTYAFAAADPEGAPLAFESSHGAIEDHGDGTGVLTLAPADLDGAVLVVLTAEAALGPSAEQRFVVRGPDPADAGSPEADAAPDAVGPIDEADGGSSVDLGLGADAGLAPDASTPDTATPDAASTPDAATLDTATPDAASKLERREVTTGGCRTGLEPGWLGLLAAGLGGLGARGSQGRRKKKGPVHR